MSSVFFPFFLENGLLKVDKILGLTSFKARKVCLRRIQNGVFPFTVEKGTATDNPGEKAALAQLFWQKMEQQFHTSSEELAELLPKNIARTPKILPKG